MAKKVEIKDVKEAIKGTALATEAGFSDGSKQNVGPQPVAPLASEIYDMKGKKLNKDFVVVRNGKEFAFKKGTAWEDIPAHFKNGLGRINFSANDFN